MQEDVPPPPPPRCAHCDAKYTYIHCPECNEVAYCDQNCQRLNAPLHEEQFECLGKRARKLSRRGRGKVSKVMREYYKHQLHSGSKKGPLVRDRKQALAIAYSEARRRRRS